MSESGSASVEHLAMVALMAVLVVLGVAAASGPGELSTDRLLGREIVRKQRCAVRYPRPCWRDPLTAAYGRELAGAVRALAPAPEARAGRGGLALVGVDYHRCKRASCAVPMPGREAHLTVSNRRTAAFTSVDESEEGAVRIDYWIYRPSLGWELVSETVDDARIAELAPTRLLDDIDPKLIPLETTLGRDESRFPPGEEPPWRNRVESRWGEER